MTENFYLPFWRDGKRGWFKVGSLTPKSTLDSSNTRIYLGQLNWPNGSGKGDSRLDDCMTITHALPSRKIKLPKNYRKIAYPFSRKELAASLVYDELTDLIGLAERIAEQYPHSLSYLVDLNEQRRELTLYPNLLLFGKTSLKNQFYY